MKTKCKQCGKYETRQKEIKTVKILGEIEVSRFSIWKWCNLKNNWCRNVAGKCEFVTVEKENKQPIKEDNLLE